MNFRRIILLCLVAFLLVVPALWFSAPLWLSKGTEYVLAQQQCSEAIVDIESIGWNRSHINRLYCNDQKGTIEIDITDAEIGYALSGLLQKRIKHVSLDSIAIQFRPSLDNKRDGKFELMPALMTPSLLLDAIPVARFEISNIHLQRQGRTGKTLQDLRGNAHYSEQGLSLVLREDSYLKGMQIKINMDKRNGFRAALNQGGRSIVHIESTIKKIDNGLSVVGTSDVAFVPLTALLKPWLNMPKQQLEGGLHGSWQVFLPMQASQPLLQQLNASAALKLNFALNRPDTGHSRGKLHLNLNYKHGVGIWSFARRSQLEFGDKFKTAADVSGLSGSFALADSGWSAKVAKNSVLQVKNILMGDVRVPHVQIKVVRAIEIAASPTGGVKLVKGATVTMGLPTLSWQGNKLAGQYLKLSIDSGSLRIPSGSFIASAIKYSSPTLTLPESNISGTFDFSAKQISAIGKVDAQESGIHLKWRLNHQLARQKGFLEFSFESLVFGAAGIDVSRIIKGQGDYAIDNGTLDFNGRLQWKNGEKKQKAKLGAQFQMKLSNLKGHYKTSLFSGLSGELYFTGDENKLLMAPALITLDSLRAGVSVNNISMRAAFTYPFAGLASVAINQLTAETLGGQISSEEISIDLARASNPFVVQLKHLDVGQIADIRHQEGLQVQGLLDGNLPFNWTRDGLNMTAGELQATPAGGLIRYTGAESVRNFASTNKATKMVLDIMDDFHYKQLKIGADYRPDGELKMRIHLKGNNPGYENGRAIVLNFNVEENVLKLLQGLGMAGDISDAVEKKVQKKLQQ